MSIHEKTDERIIAAIDSGRHLFCQLVSGLGVNDRLIDRRLQYLRKKGRVKFLGQRLGWSVVK